MAAILVGAAVLTGGVSAAAAAAQGSADNPLVTLSYLKNIFTSAVLSQTQTKINTAQTQYETALDKKIDAYKQEMASQIQKSGGTGSAVFSEVNLTKGQALTGSVGCEIMLRAGTGVCIGNESPGLIDSTSGSTLESGKSLEKNHLYLVSVQNHGVTATTAVKLLVRGEYKVS